MTQDTENQELESKVNELKATVNALTQEIVDMKERIRELENGEDNTDIDIGRSVTKDEDESSRRNTRDESGSSLEKAEDDDEIYVA